MNTYPVNDIYASIQGEGVMTGTPMVIVRLQGCSVGCSFCDTKETWSLNDFDRVFPIDPLVSDIFPKPKKSSEYIRFTAKELVNQIAVNFPAIKWILITGGEPSLYDLEELLKELDENNLYAAIETSGYGEYYTYNAAYAAWVTLSPKLHNEISWNEENIPAADEIKVVITKPQDLDALDELIKGDIDSMTIVSVQPVSGNKKITKLCFDYCLRTGYRLSIQVHKLIGAA